MLSGCPGVDKIKNPVPYYKNCPRGKYSFLRRVVQICQGVPWVEKI